MSFSGGAAATYGRSSVRASPLLTSSRQNSRDAPRSRRTVEERRVSASPGRQPNGVSHGGPAPQPLRRSPWAASGTARPCANNDRSASPSRGSGTLAPRPGPAQRVGRSPSQGALHSNSRAKSLNDSPAQHRTPSPALTRTSSAGSQRLAKGLVPADSCWEALEQILPLRNSLCTVLDQPRGAYHGVNTPGPPPRVALSKTQPTLRDLMRLRDSALTMSEALTKLNAQLADVLYPGEESSTQVRGLSQRHNSARSEAELTSQISQLQGQVDTLEDSEARCRDLESVAEQLRSRASELEEREARSSAIRDECAGLRLRIAELVAGQVQVTMLEQDRADLQARLQQLESSTGSATEQGHRTITPPTSAIITGSREDLACLKATGVVLPPVPVM